MRPVIALRAIVTFDVAIVGATFLGSFCCDGDGCPRLWNLANSIPGEWPFAGAQNIAPIK